MPRDCFWKVVEHLEYGMSRDEAMERRQRLMDERKFFVDTSNEEWFEREFSLCEH